MKDFIMGIQPYISAICSLLLIVGIPIAKYMWTQFVNTTVPAYMEEKGKNLATKQDIAIITRKTEEIQKEFKEDFESFALDLHFKNEYYAEQFSKLYTSLYEIVTQSEYVRFLIEKQSGEKYPFEEYPFLSISKTKKETQSLNFKEGQPATFKVTTKEIATPESEFTSENLCQLIIDNGDYASQKLLKSAIAFRIAKDKDEDESQKIIANIVTTIVEEYNGLRKELKMPYEESELTSGRIQF